MITYCCDAITMTVFFFLFLSLLLPPGKCVHLTQKCVHGEKRRIYCAICLCWIVRWCVFSFVRSFFQMCTFTCQKRMCMVAAAQPEQHQQWQCRTAKGSLASWARLFVVPLLCHHYECFTILNCLCVAYLPWLSSDAFFLSLSLSIRYHPFTHHLLWRAGKELLLV